MTDHPSRSVYCRPREHLKAAAMVYPGAWKQVDQFRAGRGHDGLPDWPEWCFLPLAAAYAIVSGGGDNQVSPEMAGDVGRLGAMAAWRVTQGIYRFDETLLQSLIETPVSGDLPVEVLYRLPEWCVYIETPGFAWMGEALAGFFAHIEWDANTGREELRLVLDITKADGYLLLPIPVHLGADLAAGIKAANLEAQRQAWKGRAPKLADDIRELESADLEIEPLVSLLLYLCSVTADFGNGERRPKNPEAKKTKRGWRMFPADKPTTWPVGERVGAALRSGYAAANSTGIDTHTGPRPHIRRAHWHTYWTGPRDGNQKPVLKWLPPIPINVENVDDLPAVVRDVD